VTRLFHSWFYRWLVVPPVGCLSLLLLVGTIAWYGYRHAGTAKRDAAVARLDADDPLWRTTALTNARNAALPPPDRNAAIQAARVYAAVPPSFKKWSRDEKLRKELKPGHLPHPEDVRPARRALLDATAALEKARGIRHLPGGGFPLTFKDPDHFGTLLPDLQNTREVASLLDVHALISAYDRKGDQAVESALACLAVSRGIGDEPFLISQLVRIAEAAIAVRSAERVLGLCEVGEPRLADLQTAFAVDAEAPRMLYGLRGERAGFHRMLEGLDGGALSFRHLEGGSFERGQSVTERVQLVPFRATIPEQQHTALSLFNRLIEASQKPPGPDRDAVMNSVEAEVKMLPRLSNIAVRLLLPAVSKVNEADTRIAALLRCGSVAVACERYRLKTKRYPDTLDELPKDLLPAVPADPYTGKPLLYKKTDDGAAVYCTGQDRGDDGGTDLDATARKGDFGFRLFDLPHRRQPPLPRTEQDPFDAVLNPTPGGTGFGGPGSGIISASPPRSPAPAVPPRKP
jgi:hypothetical protein